MNRYSHTKVKKDKNGVRSLKITRYPKILIRDTDTFHFARDVERFDWLAHKYYDASTLWWIISKANGYSHESRPKVGDKVRIPRDINSILQEFYKLNK